MAALHGGFKNKRVNISRLLDYGFEKAEDSYIYRTDLLKGQFVMSVRISESGEVETEVIDTATDDEYVLLNVVGASGAFVGEIREAYENELSQIAKHCFDLEVFKCPQSKQVIKYVAEKYGDSLEFLWEKSPENAVLRRKDNNKWYAALLTVQKQKLGFPDEGSVEIIDLKADPVDIEKLVDGKRYLPGYHMNKKHWFTICLDGSVALEEIHHRIDASYLLAKK